MWSKINIGCFLTVLVISAEIGLAKQIVISPNSKGTALQDAILSAEPHDTIVVSEGSYLEHNVLVDKP